MAELLFGIPSKGRMHEEAVKWLVGAAMPLDRGVAARGYLARLQGVEGLEVHLLSAGEIAATLDSGKLHIGLTGLDLLHERAAGLGAKLRIVAKLGFSRARVVVAVPEAWIDVDTMSDLRDVAARFHERTRERLRVATKFRHLTRRFFASHGLFDYRIVPSLGATEGAPSAGAAELVVDITETGSTLAANQLRILDDGIILESEAVLAASSAASWSASEIDVLRGFMRRLGQPAGNQLFKDLAAK
jgi:ATP phosphoribosyltransferase